MDMRVVNWENKMSDDIDERVLEYCDKHYPNLDLTILSGLANRDPIDIIDSIRQDCKAVVVRPYMVDKDQFTELASLLGAGIYGYLYGHDLEEFIFLVSDAEESANEISGWFQNFSWNEDHKNPRNALVAILKRVRCFFVDPTDIKYEVTTSGWGYRDFEVSKIK